MKKLCVISFHDDEIFACPFCFNQIDDEDNFCAKCGAKIDEEGTIWDIDSLKKEIKKLEKDK